MGKLGVFFFGATNKSVDILISYLVVQFLIKYNIYNPKKYIFGKILTMHDEVKY